MPFVSRRIRNNITGKVYSDPEMRLLARRWHCGKSASGDGSNHKDGGRALPLVSSSRQASDPYSGGRTSAALKSPRGAITNSYRRAGKTRKIARPVAVCCRLVLGVGGWL